MYEALDYFLKGMRSQEKPWERLSRRANNKSTMWNGYNALEEAKRIAVYPHERLSPDLHQIWMQWEKGDKYWSHEIYWDDGYDALTTSKTVLIVVRPSRLFLDKTDYMWMLRVHYKYPMPTIYYTGRINHGAHPYRDDLQKHEYPKRDFGDPV